MKKSTRILSVFLALTMLLGIFSVFGSAYQDYKGTAIQSYNDIDKPMFTTEQYATMACDELDRMLAEEQLYLTEDDIFVGELDLRSVNQTLSSLGTLIDSADQLLPLLGAAKDLSIDSLYYNKANKVMLQRQNVAGGNSTDLNIFLSLIGFLYDNVDIFYAYVNHTISLGILDGVVADFLFNIRNLLMGLLVSIMDDDVDAMDYTPPADLKLDALLQDLVEWALIGVYDDNGSSISLRKEADNPESNVHEGLIWEYIGNGGLPYSTEKDIIKNTINICNTDANAYDFIEKLLQDAFNYIAVPELNKVTRPWLRETAGIPYDHDKMDSKTGQYPAGYEGEAYTEADLDPQLAAVFDLDGMYIPECNVPAGETFISNLNSFLGDVVDIVLLGEEGVDWEWDRSKGDAALFQNIASVAKFVLKAAGDKFFSDYIDIPSDQEYDEMSDQEIYTFVITAILNSSVDWMYVDPDECKTLADMGYSAVEQLAWQDIPQCDYTKPVRSDYATDSEYYDAIVDKVLDILMDIAVYNLNQHFDMVPASRASGASQAENGRNGLLAYSDNWETIALQVATWGVHNYGKMLTSEGCTLDAIQLDPNGDGSVGNCTVNDAWEDIDLIVNSIIPLSSTLSGANVWINSSIAAKTNSDGGSDVVRSILFDNIIGSVVNLDFSGLEALLTKNATGTFANNTIKTVVIEFLKSVLNLIFPGTLTGNFATLDDVLQNSVLANAVRNLLTAFYTHREEWAVVALPVVCDILGLTDAQEFGEMENYMPSNISSTAGSVAFQIYNGCSGLNTGYVNDLGNFFQDNLYTYEITGISCVTSGAGAAANSVSASGIAVGDKIVGGASKTVTLAGNFVNGSVIEFTIKYKVQDENYKANNPSYLADGVELASTRYAYVGPVAEDDSDYKVPYAIDSTFSASAPYSVYLNKGKGLGDVDDFIVSVKRASSDSGSNINVSVSVENAPAWLTVNPNAAAVTTTKDGGTFNFVPLAVADGYSRHTVTYTTQKIADDDSYWSYPALYVLDENRNYVSDDFAGFDPDTTYYVRKDNAETSTDTLVEDGAYTATVRVTAGSQSVAIPVYIFLYDDAGLTSLYNNAVTANRQSGDFEEGTDTQWNAYKTALQNAGNLVLAPKSYTNFMANQAATDPTYATKYAELYDALADAIAEIDEYSKSAGVTGLKNALESIVGTSNSYYLTDSAADAPVAAYGETARGWNSVKYYATANSVAEGESRYAYSYFGSRDFVPHTYDKFKSARNDAEKLINQATVYPPIAPVEPADASSYEHSKYLEEYAVYEQQLAAYEERIANPTALNPVDVAYALAMVQLTGARLIALESDNDKLALVVSKYGGEVKGNYNNDTWGKYVIARDFANETLDMGTDARPSQVTKALSELVSAYKRLNEGVDYTALVEAINNAVTNSSAYTPESWEAYQAVLQSAIDLVASDLAASTSNQDKVDAKTAELIAAATDVLVLNKVDSEPEFTLAAEAAFYGNDYTYQYAPYIDSEKGVNFGMEFECILGLGTDCDWCGPLDSYMLDYIINPESLDNAYAVWEPNSSGLYGTGSYINIMNMHGTDDESDDEVYATYYLVIVGDTNGDGMMNGEDTTNIFTLGDMMYWMYDPELFAIAVASDTDNSESISGGDADNIFYACNTDGFMAQNGTGYHAEFDM